MYGTAMLRIRNEKAETTLLEAHPGHQLVGLEEDTDYIIFFDAAVEQVYIDDVILHYDQATAGYRWRPRFYSGNVKVEAVLSGGAEIQQYFLSIGPKAKKASSAQFNAMVEQIREFDQTLILGLAAATQGFGRDGRYCLFEYETLLARVLTHGPRFLTAAHKIARLPHRSLAAKFQLLPLSQIRRLHTTTLRSHRVLSMLAHGQNDSEDIERLRLRSATHQSTFDTPANRAVLALLKRFHTRVTVLIERISALKLNGDEDEQRQRQPRRLHLLRQLQKESVTLLRMSPFNEVRTAGTTAAGLTQIAAHPLYSRCYRFGSQALANGLDGPCNDELHVRHSWGIYETWCLLAVLRALALILARPLCQVRQSGVATADMVFGAALADGSRLEVLFQPKFPAFSPNSGKLSWSISRERVPDIVLVHIQEGQYRTFVLDAKWRSGRSNILEAMESAHIYHDALRVAGRMPECCLLLLPGAAEIPELAAPEYAQENGVGAICDFAVGGSGLAGLERRMGAWLQ
ncbi:DUF2357 domain-containing protein [Pusillimonas sp. TS35]|nr:DUF2357 domain-containing protein [Pusillimonas sp. TS35]